MPTAKARILVVEDDPAILNGLLDVLVFNGYDVEGAADGRDGLQNALDETYDLVILDVMMPKMDGFTALEKIKTDAPLPNATIRTQAVSTREIRAVGSSAFTALRDPDGLLAVGGDLTAERLLAAYRNGIFPWYESGQPILWWSPDPRAVLLPGNFHLSGTLMTSAEWAARNGDPTDFNAWLAAGVAAGWAGMITSAYGQHMMPFVNDDMNDWAVHTQAQMVSTFYGYTPTVAWVPERVWLNTSGYPSSGVNDWIGDNWEAHGVYGVILDDDPHLVGHDNHQIHTLSGTGLRLIPRDRTFTGNIIGGNGQGSLDILAGLAGSGVEALACLPSNSGRAATRAPVAAHSLRNFRRPGSPPFIPRLPRFEPCRARLAFRAPDGVRIRRAFRCSRTGSR